MKMASEVKYTAEQVEALVAGVAEGKTVEAMAAEMGKSVRSVVAKLAQMKLYKAKETAKAEVRMTKAQMVTEMEIMLELSLGTLASFAKADKEALEHFTKAARMRLAQMQK